jgi:hypothetical protein
MVSLASVGMADGVKVFQGARNGDTKQLQQTYSPRLESIHYMVRETSACMLYFMTCSLFLSLVGL